MAINNIRADYLPTFLQEIINQVKKSNIDLVICRCQSQCRHSSLITEILYRIKVHRNYSQQVQLIEILIALLKISNGNAWI